MLGLAKKYLGKGLKSIPGTKIGRRAMLGAGYLGASSGLNFALGRAADYDAAYYGEDNRAGYERLQGVSNFLANTAALGAMFGADPANLLRGSGMDIGNLAAKTATFGKYGGKINKTRLATMVGAPLVAQSVPGLFEGGANAYEISGSLGGAVALAPMGVMLATRGAKAAFTRGGLVGGGAFYAGTQYGPSYEPQRTAEGRITSMGSNGSAVRRMNYSTAGLGLAMHRNR